MKQIRANEQIKQQLPHTQEKKREDETGKIAPLLKKKKLLYCLQKEIVVLSNEEVLRSFMSVDYFA